MSKNDFRKEFSFFRKAGGHEANLMLTPTNVALSVILEDEHYGLKASINVGFQGARR
jgi:hypothetical protein